MSATIKDVARKAGVSHTTVSMVINNDNRITPLTRDKVLKAIKELNYHPNYFARGLVKGKTNTIAVVASFFSSVFEIEILKGIEQEIDQYTYNINQYSTRGRAKTKNELFDMILYGKRADAVIALSLKPEIDQSENYLREHVPLVLVEEELSNAHVVKGDNFKGAYMATEYLIKSGKKRIGFVTGTIEGEETGLSPKERLAGYKAALQVNRREFDLDLIIITHNYYFEDGFSLLNSYMESSNMVDAIFCAAGDIVAMGIIDEAKRRKIAIPEKLSIIGYDDVFAAALITPSLSTIRQSIFQMGAKALDIVISELSGKGQKRVSIIYEPQLILRDSTL